MKQRVREEQLLSVNTYRNCVSKNLDETVRLQPRENWMQEVKGKKLQRPAETRKGVAHLVNSSAAPFPGKKECLEIHCSSIVKQERERAVPVKCTREFELKK